MAISATMVKQLRDKTGAGMMDAKKALSANNGDMEAATGWLRTKGLAAAAKKSGRTAAEGLVAIKIAGNRKGVVVEVNSETDFVAKNSEFQDMVGKISTAALEAEDVEALAKTDLGGKSVADTLTEAIAKIGENMTLRRMGAIEGESVVSYVHGAVREGMGRIGVLVALKGSDSGIGRQVAMHIAAANPASLGEEDLDPGLVAKERQVQIDMARESGKPEAVIEKMIAGRMKKWLAEVTLLGQSFVVQPDQTVREAVKEAGVEIVGFVRMEVGEGIEKADVDFAAEVAKAIDD